MFPRKISWRKMKLDFRKDFNEALFCLLEKINDAMNLIATSMARKLKLTFLVLFVRGIEFCDIYIPLAQFFDCSQTKFVAIM